MDLDPDATSTTDLLLHEYEKFLPGFQCAVKWGGRYLSGRFLMSVNELARVEYLAQGATTCDITESMLMLQILCWKTEGRYIFQYHQDTPGYIPKDVNCFRSLPPCNKDLSLMSVPVPSEGENWLETLS